MSLTKISIGGQMSTCKISTGGQMSILKISLGGGGGANVRVAFSTGRQMSIYTFFHWGANALGGANVRRPDMYMAQDRSFPFSA